MLFFSLGLPAFNKGIAHIFSLSSESDDEESEGQGQKEGVEESEERISDADKNFKMLSFIHMYSSFTLIDWDRVWDKNIWEFFNTIAFILEYKKREEEYNKKNMKKYG